MEFAFHLTYTTCIHVESTFIWIHIFELDTFFCNSWVWHLTSPTFSRPINFFCKTFCSFIRRSKSTWKDYPSYLGQCTTLEKIILVHLSIFKGYFNGFLLMRVFTHDKNKINQSFWIFKMPRSFDFVLAYLPKVDSYVVVWFQLMTSALI